MLRWDKNDGVRLSGLATRRAAERELFLRAAPIEARTQPEKGMAPILAAAAPALVSALIGQLTSVIPELARIFTDKTTPVSERNVQAGIKVLEAAQRVAGTSGPAAAVERIVAEPEIAQQFRDTVGPMIELAEVGGGIKAAREHTAAVLAMGGWTSLGYGALMFIVAVGIVIGGGGVMGYVLLATDAKPEVVATILDYYKAAGFIVLGFLYGTSRSSQRKDETIRELGAQR